MHQPARRPRTHGFDITLALVAVALVAASLLGSRDRGPRGPQPSALSGTLVVADLRGHGLLVHDLATSTVRRIALPGGPHELLPLPDGRVAVSLEQAGTLALVDLETLAVDYLDTGGLPHGLLLDGNALLVTDRAASAIRRFELGSWRELEALPTGALPHQLAMSGRDLLVADASSAEFRLGLGRVAWQPAVTESLAVSADGSRVAIAGARDGLVRILEVASGEGQDVPLGARPVRVAFAPHDADLAVALSASGEVALVGPEGRVDRIEIGGVPDGLAFANDGATLFASDIAGGPVSVIDVRTSRVVAHLDGGATPGALLYLPALPAHR
ncbi:MAG: hypothetical protein IT299_05610 [Dehalococcoidia bacterium]|nr:hypothetical protein [Dehalococcoidia bacterium]